ncbi:hypothetical protein O181_126048 [Austropuccinia psidii MF-1]|uniref:Uncharacterized protein n=1 Tax=Austropuccinia psidii MF-1 TaxID=1389203 RepID=A0A9Q3KQR6_9BASI|nr:hypothetical protein [Austropuccinia psidii MF-1]
MEHWESESEPIEQYLLEYYDEKPASILENCLKPEFSQPKNVEDLSGSTTDSKEYLENPKIAISFIHVEIPNVDVYIENTNHPLIVDTGETFSVVSRKCLDRHFQLWHAEILVTKAKGFKSASGKMESL